MFLFNITLRVRISTYEDMSYMTYFVCMEGDSNILSSINIYFMPFFPSLPHLSFPSPLPFLSLCSPSCTRTHYVNQAGLELTDICLLLPPEYWN